MSQTFSRRQFLSATVTSTVAVCAAPTILAQKKTGSAKVIGSGAYQFEVLHDWPQLPDRFQWQTTHNVAVDKDGCLYVIHEGRAQEKDHPSIFVFDPEGRYMRSFGNQFQGGGHGIEVHEENGQQFLYICAYQQVKAFSKLDLNGEVIWHKHAPMDSGVYAAGEDTNPQKIWGRDRFMPTNITFLPDGDFLLADGYGSFYIHRYDADGSWKSCFGGPGEGKGKFNTPHGLWIDRRPGREPALVVCDRAHHTLQYMTLDGRYLETMEGYGLPANIDTQGSLMIVPELLARLTILDGDNRVVAQLGADVERIGADKKHTIRNSREQWQSGKFVHPHDACFNQEGDIFVAEWVQTGRVTKLRKVS